MGGLLSNLYIKGNIMQETLRPTGNVKIPIKMRLPPKGYEKLRPICVWTTICHREKTRSIVSQFKTLICKSQENLHDNEQCLLSMQMLKCRKFTCKLPSVNTFSTSAYKPIKGFPYKSGYENRSRTEIQHL